MPKAQRTKSKLRSKDSSIRSRKSAVDNKQTKESIVEELDNVASKNLKRKIRHDAWLEKLDTSYNAKQQQKKKADKRKNGLKTDLSSFSDILNTIKIEPKIPVQEVEAATAPAPVKPAVLPSTSFKSKKARKKAEMQEILRFQKVMQHSAFQQNPMATIRQHVQNTFANEIA
ncbi:ribosome biogenesis protein SLX9-domain-containing protein [Phycomyces blakesleeanus]|uniref:Ribosome biogenesis protein SLX9 n=1 Tax=Phycomyces blakesleeanus TaxID=4837 RepID=A0ABR3BFG0_PHYBL